MDRLPAHLFRTQAGLRTCERCSGTGSYYDSTPYRTEPHFLNSPELPEAGICFDCEGSGKLRLVGGEWTAAPSDVVEKMHWQALESDPPAVRERARLLTSFRTRFGANTYKLLVLLEGREPERYEQALHSLARGRDHDVARALREWHRGL